jgi:hypothetical protein
LTSGIVATTSGSTDLMGESTGGGSIFLGELVTLREPLGDSVIWGSDFRRDSGVARTGGGTVRDEGRVGRSTLDGSRRGIISSSLSSSTRVALLRKKDGVE